MLPALGIGAKCCDHVTQNPSFQPDKIRSLYLLTSALFSRSFFPLQHLSSRTLRRSCSRGGGTWGPTGGKHVWACPGAKGGCWFWSVCTAHERGREGGLLSLGGGRGLSVCPRNHPWGVSSGTGRGVEARCLRSPQSTRAVKTRVCTHTNTSHTVTLHTPPACLWHHPSFLPGGE